MSVIFKGRIIAGKLVVDAVPTAGSTNPVSSQGVKAALDAKQNTLTFDQTPTAGSQNPVTSGGVKSALDNVETALSNDSAFSTLTGNGYIKFPDGTMMQWGRAEAYVTFTAWGNMYESSAISIGDFPIAFVGEKPVMQLSLNNSGSAAFGARVGGDYPTLTSGGSVFVYRPNNPGTTTACIGWLAIGRWKI